MAVLIDYKIPNANFELVRNQIAIILKEEIENQLLMNSDEMDLGVFIERTVPISNSEECVINISLADVDFNDQNNHNGEGVFQYFIDIYGFQIDSAFKVQLLHNYTRHILKFGEYQTLGFKPGFIGGSNVTGFQMKTDLIGQDSDYVKISRLFFSVRINEYQGDSKGIPLLENHTKYKIEETNLGYEVVNKELYD